MSNINSVIIEGNLVAAAQLSRWNNGTPYCRFTVANNESYKDNAGTWIDIPSYFDCLMKGAYAESMSKHLLKGRRVTVKGRLKQSRWTDDKGNKRSAVIIKVEEVSLAPGAFQPKENNVAVNTGAGYAADAGADNQQYEDYGAMDESDMNEIPF